MNSQLKVDHERIVEFGRKIDLHTPKDLSRYFRDQVIAEAEVQYAA